VPVHKFTALNIMITVFCDMSPCKSAAAVAAGVV
jgi:hypothetical protein